MIDWAVSEGLSRDRCRGRQRSGRLGPVVGHRAIHLAAAAGILLGATAVAAGSGEGESSAAAAGAPAAAAQASVAVKDLAAAAVSSRQIDVTFSAPAAGTAAPADQLPAKRYLVKQSRRPITPATFAAGTTLCGGACSFTVSRPGDRIKLMVGDLIPDRQYYYALRPLDSAGRTGALSNVAGTRTLKDRVRPGRPTRRSARALSGARVRLRFGAPGSDGLGGPPVSRYVIKQSARPIRTSRQFRRARALCRSTCRFAPRSRGSRLSLSVRGLCPGRRYHYAVRAKDEGGNFSRIARFRAVRAKGRPGLVCL